MAVIREWSLVPPADATECDWDARGVVAVDPPSNESRRLCSIAAAAAAAAAAICCSGVSGVGIAAIAAFARAVRASGLSGESPAAAPSRLLRLVAALLLPELKNVGDPPLVGELVASLLPAYEAIVLVHPSIHDTAVSSPVPSSRSISVRHVAAAVRSYTIATVPPAGAGSTATASRVVRRWYATVGSRDANSLYTKQAVIILIAQT
jgi:hypothetical protein